MRNYGLRAPIPGLGGIKRNEATLEVRALVERQELVADCKACGERLLTLSMRQVRQGHRTAMVLVDQAIRKHQREKECVSETTVSRVEKAARA